MVTYVIKETTCVLNHNRLDQRFMCYCYKKLTCSVQKNKQQIFCRESSQSVLYNFHSDLRMLNCIKTVLISGPKA